MIQTLIANGIAVLILLVIVGAACSYIYKEKKKGTKCIGCPMAGNCSRKNHCDDKPL